MRCTRRQAPRSNLARAHTAARRRSMAAPLHPSAAAAAAAAAAGAAAAGAAPMPRMLYGTAWKKERTASLVEAAVLAGFRGIDTACQPKHYQEDGVGAALAALQQKHGIPRSSLFVQTKFTPIDGQDASQPLPYDPRTPLAEQVRQSFATSLRNLGTDYVDCLLLHSPLRSHEQSMQVWRAFERLVADGAVRRIGLSNCYDEAAFARLCADAAVAPSVLQNRFHAKSGFDRGLRTACRQAGIAYQSFWTLTANPDAVHSPVVARIAARRRVQPEQVWYRFVMQLGITPLNGTTNAQHMADDLAVLDWEQPLSSDEMRAVGALIGEPL